VVAELATLAQLQIDHRCFAATMTVGRSYDASLKCAVATRPRLVAKANSRSYAAHLTATQKLREVDPVCKSAGQLGRKSA